MNIFDPKNVVEYYKEEAFKQIPSELLLDFLPSIYKSQVPILASWKDHFMKLGVPFAVTKVIDVYGENGKQRKYTRFTLWKQWRV